MAKRLQAFEMWTYRRMLRISWTEKMSNETEPSRLNVKDRLFKIIQGKKQKYFGHKIRHDDTLQRAVLHGKVNGKIVRGRPRTKWTTNIEKWKGMGYHQAVRQTHDRKKWRAIASNPH